MRVYFDSDIMIWHLRGDKNAKGFFNRFIDDTEYEMWTGAIQRAEIVFFMRPNEVEVTTAFLSNFKCAVVNQEIVDRAGKIYRKWHPSHGIDVNDAILAATVQTTGGKLFTLNTKHYPIKDLIVEKAW